MLKNLLKNSIFRQIIKKFYKENKEIVDIVLFGSTVRGKESPRDIDLMVIFNKKIDDSLVEKLNKELINVMPKIEITSVTYRELFSPKFLAREAYLTEGYSLINKKYIFSGLGFETYEIFKYNVKNLSKSRLMSFYYALYGRNNNKGMLEKLNGIKFSNEVILSPIENSEEFKEFLDSWNIKYFRFPAIIPSRIAKSKVIKELKNGNRSKS